MEVREHCVVNVCSVDFCVAVSLDYKTPKPVTILLPKGARTSTCAIRWRQVSQSSSDQDTWALNHIIFVPFSAAGSVARQHVVEFDLYMRSDAVARESFGIRVDYSVDLGRTWSAVLPPCYSWNSTACHRQLVCILCLLYLFV